MASEQMQAASELLRADTTFKGGLGDIAALRAGMAANVLPVAADVRTEQSTLGGRPALRVCAPGADDTRVLLYFHGGGYLLGSPDTHHELMGRLSRACRATVIGIDYRLAPEHPYPAAVEDATGAYTELLGACLNPADILLGGDSAGGGLALACLQALAGARSPLPAGAILMSPWTDLTGSGASIRSRAEADPMVSPELLGPMAEHYRGDRPAADPGISPLFGELAGLPPLLIQVGDHEILLDDSTRLAERAEAAGVKVELTVYDGAFHVFQTMPNLPESQDALSSIGQFFERCAAP